MWFCVLFSTAFIIVKTPNPEMLYWHTIVMSPACRVSLHIQKSQDQFSPRPSHVLHSYMQAAFPSSSLLTYLYIYVNS